jgi:hypothetical protein
LYRVTAEQKQTDRQHGSNDHHNNPSGFFGMRSPEASTSSVRFNPWARELEWPCDDERDRKSYCDHHDDQPDNPVRNFQERKDWVAI